MILVRPNHHNWQLFIWRLPSIASVRLRNYCMALSIEAVNVASMYIYVCDYCPICNHWCPEEKGLLTEGPFRVVVVGENAENRLNMNLKKQMQ